MSEAIKQIDYTHIHNQNKKKKSEPSGEGGEEKTGGGGREWELGTEEEFEDGDILRKDNAAFESFSYNFVLTLKSLFTCISFVLLKSEMSAAKCYASQKF